MSEEGDAVMGKVEASISDAEVVEAVNVARLTTLGLLLAGVAHEVNTPLGALASNHDVLKRALEKLQAILADEVVDESELVEVRRIVRALAGIMRVNDLAIERVVGLVASLRTFGRLDRTQVDRVDLHEGIDTTLVLLRHRLEDRIVIRRKFGELPLVECYPQELNQVFMNLLMNSVQAIEGPGEILIRTRPVGETEVEILIRDTGSGMDRETVQRIFEPGFTTKNQRVGMGMGLLISRRVVDRHGGRIEVQSEPGAGSTFTLRLPLALPPHSDKGGTGKGAGS
jgi:two-component system, NtrC family, sensor kinase